MISLLLIFGSFCLGHYLGRKDGQEIGYADAVDQFSEYCCNNGCHLNEDPQSANEGWVDAKF